MKKLAIFVEGQTERLLLERLLRKIADQNKVSIEVRRMFGGTRSRRAVVIYQSEVRAHERFFVLIVDSGSDGSVGSDLLDQPNISARRIRWNCRDPRRLSKGRGRGR